MKRIVDKSASVLFAALIFLLILSFSISVPILVRPIYYAHISPLSLTESGYSEAEIKTAYNEVLDYLTFLREDFSCGGMLFSANGQQHFAECKILFGINFAALAVSASGVLTMLVFWKKKKLSLSFSRHSAAYYGAIAAVLLPAVFGTLAAIDFDKAFEFFHLILFPSNKLWEFYPSKDEIINVLPSEFFMNCGTIIAILVFALSAAIITADLLKRGRKNETD